MFRKQAVKTSLSKLTQTAIMVEKKCAINLLSPQTSLMILHLRKIDITLCFLYGQNKTINL